MADFRLFPYIASLTVVALLNKTPLDETVLHRQFSAGDPAAFRDIVKTYFPVLCKFAEKFLPDSSLAKDIVQETFIKLWQYEGSFETYQGLKSFLFIVTKNGCLNLQRGRARQEEKHNNSFPPDNSLAGSDYDEIARLEHLARINQVVQQMPRKMQAVFLLSFRQGLSITEIAEKLNISVKTVRNQKSRSLVILRSVFTSRASFLLVLAFLQ